MATLAPNGRINEATVRDEIARLSAHWRAGQQNTTNSDGTLIDLLGDQRVDQIDLFDRAQLATVVDVCRDSRSISAAGRTLFAISRAAKASGNDADRLRKYLARFGLRFEDISEAAHTKGSPG